MDRIRGFSGRYVGVLDRLGARFGVPWERLDSGPSRELLGPSGRFRAVLGLLGGVLGFFGPSSRIGLGDFGAVTWVSRIRRPGSSHGSLGSDDYDNFPPFLACGHGLWRLRIRVTESKSASVTSMFLLANVSCPFELVASHPLHCLVCVGVRDPCLDTYISTPWAVVVPSRVVCGGQCNRCTLSSLVSGTSYACVTVLARTFCAHDRHTHRTCTG